MFLDCYPPYSLFNFFPIKYSLLVTSFVYHYSSIVNEAIRAISSLFIFFLREHFATQKTHKKKPTNKTKISEKKNNKSNNFRAQKLYLRGQLVYLALFFSFKISYKKIWNYPDSLIYEATGVCSPQPSYGKFICM